MTTEKYYLLTARNDRVQVLHSFSKKSEIEEMLNKGTINPSFIGEYLVVHGEILNIKPVETVTSWTVEE